MPDKNFSWTTIERNPRDKDRLRTPPSPPKVETFTLKQQFLKGIHSTS